MLDLSVPTNPLPLDWMACVVELFENQCSPMQLEHLIRSYLNLQSPILPPTIIRVIPSCAFQCDQRRSIR